MVVERLGLFDPQQRRLLAIAAVIGRPFAHTFLQQIANEPATLVAHTLQLACEQQLLAEIPGDPLAYRFRHALTREAVADEMPAAELRPLHRQIAEKLEATAPDHFADIGYHFWSAYEPEPARIYNERAGDAAERSRAYADAVRFYERALAMSEDDLVRAPLFASIARCLAHTGEPDRAMGFYEAATRLYRTAGRVAEAASLSYSLISAAHFFGDGAHSRSLSRH
jgi:tetratricopeptide (TPR) repeat protein